jgi:hypothetical protein
MGKTLALGGADQMVRLWDLAAGSERLPSTTHQDSVHAVAISPDGRTFATGCGDKIIRLWDSHTAKERLQIKGHENGIWSLAFTPDGGILISTDFDETIRTWDMSTGRELYRITGEGCVLSSDGNTLVTGGKVLHALEMATGKELCRFQVPGEGAAPLGLSLDGRILYSWGSDRQVRFWDVTTGKELRHFDGHHFSEDAHDRIYCLAASPDGRFVAFGGQLNYIPIYNMTTGKEAKRLTGLPGAVSSLAFSADSRKLASADWTGGTVNLWEVETGQRIQKFAGHQGRGFNIAFAADGSILITGNEDTTALVWDLTGKLGAKEKRAGPLTEAELDSCWSDLAGKDAIKAYHAIRRLAACSSDSVPYFGKHLRPVAHLDHTRLARLITDLDSAEFAVRQTAEKELEQLGELAVPACRVALERNTSAEVRRRLRAVLDKQTQVDLNPSMDRLRMLRAVETLEMIGTADAREVLAGLAKGAPQARLSQEARASLDRLAIRANSMP